jgi:bacterial/archaeal transporter family protein
MLTGFMVLMIVVSNAAGDVLITRGMKEIGDISAVSPLQFLRVVKSILCNRNFLGGVFCLAISFFSFLIVLSWADLSFVVPATAIFYVVSILGAKFVLKENINSMRWAGTLLVGIGVALVCIP